MPICLPRTRPAMMPRATGLRNELVKSVPRETPALARAKMGRTMKVTKGVSTYSSLWSGGMDFGESAKRRILGPEVQAAGPETYEAVVAPLRRSFLQHGDPDDTTGTAMESMPDGLYTLVIHPLDRVGNECEFEYQFILDRTCPSIDSLYVTQSGQADHEDTLFASWDYVEINEISPFVYLRSAMLFSKHQVPFNIIFSFF